MIIYTDSEINPEDMFGVKEVTPAHLYSQTKDFSVILDDIANDKIPCGTGKPFDVVWKNDQNNNNVPWMNGTETFDSFINNFR